MKSSKRKLGNAYQHAYESRDKGGAQRPQIIDWRKAGDPKFYSSQEGANKLNVIPFEIKSTNHPLVKQKRMEIGELDFALDIWVHRYVGATQADVVCLKKNYNKPCPLCAQSKELYDQGKKDDAKALAPTRRVFINVQPIIKGEKKPLMVFDVSHYLFMKELMEEAHECGNGESIVPFADIEKGKVIKFRATEEEFGRNKMMNYKSFQFLDRDEELEDSLIDEAISFDEHLIVLSAEEIEKLLYAEDAEEDDAPAKKRHSDDDDDDEEEEEERPAKKREEEEEDEEERPMKKHHKDDDDEEDEPPAKKHRDEEDDEEEEKSSKHTSKKSDDDDEEEEEEDDEKPAKKESSKSATCPSGHVYGKDCDKFKECGKCPKWDACVDYDKE